MSSYNYHHHYQHYNPSGGTGAGDASSIAPFFKFYDAGKRQAEIASAWDKCKDKIKGKVENRLREPRTRGEMRKNGEQQVNGGGDPCLVLLNELENKIHRFRQERETFKGECFSKLFRQLQTTGIKIQGELDLINTQNEELRKRKKQLTTEVENIFQGIKEQVHENPCEKCDVTYI